MAVLVLAAGFMLPARPQASDLDPSGFATAPELEFALESSRFVSVKGSEAAYYEAIVRLDLVSAPPRATPESEFVFPTAESLGFGPDEAEDYALLREAALRAPAAPPPAPTLTSFLLLSPIPGPVRVEEWSVETAACRDLPSSGERSFVEPSVSLDWIPFAPDDESFGWVSLHPARLGTYDGLQVVLDVLNMIEQKSFATHDGIALRLRSPPFPVAAFPSPSVVAPAETRSDPAAAAAARRLFAGVALNADDFDRFPVAAPAPIRERALLDAPPPLPSPPGSFRGVYEEGDTVLTFDIASVGGTGTDLDATRLVYRGAVLPVLDRPSTSTLRFYAPRTHTLTDRTDSVFLCFDDPAAASPTMATRAAFETLAPAAAEVPQPRARRFEWNLLYERAAVRPLGERFVFNRLRGGQNQTYSFPLDDRLTTTTVHVAFALLGYNQTDGVDPDHYVDLTVQGVDLPRHAWKGRTATTFAIAVELPAIPAPSVLTVRHTVPTGSPFVSGIDFQNLDLVEVEWTGLPRLDADGVCRLELPEAPDGLPRRVTVGGFPLGTGTAGILVLDVTDRSAPVRLVGAPTFADDTGGVAVEFEAPPEASVFHVQHAATVASLTAVVAAAALPVLPVGEALHGLFVRDPVFEATLAPLVALRNPGIVELSPQAAYDAFNHGQESPEALRAALSAIIEAADLRSPVPWILLVGRGSLDRRNYLGLDDGPQIPPFIDPGVVTSGGFSIETPTDYPYSLLAGEDQLPDAFVGRIPAGTPAELETVVARILAQDARADTLRALPRRGLFVADNDFAFLLDAGTWVSMWEPTGKPAVRLDLAAGVTTETLFIQQVLEAPDGGAAFVHYVGHGNTDRWSQKQVVNNAKVAGFNTDGQWPVVAALTCLSGYYSFPGGLPTLSETWLFTAADRGAVANYAPSAVDYYEPIRRFIVEFLGVLDSPHRPTRASELLTRAQLAYALKFPELIGTAREYHLFGDPMTDLTLDTPPPARVPDWAVFSGRDGKEGGLVE